MKPRNGIDLHSRFLNKIFFETHQIIDGCWHWHSSIRKDGYAFFRFPDGYLAHVYSYKQYIGDYPAHLDLDHTCRNRWCVNPFHLEPVTRQVNILRSPITIASINKAKTHCKRGHLLSQDNVYIQQCGGRGCKECRKLRGREWARKNLGYQPERYRV